MAQTVKSWPEVQEAGVPSLGWEDPWKRKWQPTPVSLLGKFLGRRSLVCYSPWSCKEWDTTKRLYFHFFTFFHFTHTCPSGNHLFVLCMRLFSFCFLNSTYKWNHRLCHSDLLHPVKYPVELCMLLEMARFWFFFTTNIPLYMCIYVDVCVYVYIFFFLLSILLIHLLVDFW